MELCLRHVRPNMIHTPYSHSLGYANGVGRNTSLFLRGNRYKMRHYTPDSAKKSSASHPLSIWIHAANLDTQEKPMGETTLQHIHLPI